MKARTLGLALIAIHGMAVTPQFAVAASEIANARVEILPALGIDQTTQVDFGQLHNANGSCVMNAAGELSGPSEMACSGTRTPGVFTISGASGGTIIVSTTQGAAQGVTFQPLVAGGPSHLLENGQATITVGGSLILDSASEGIKNITYTFTANYQ